MSNSLRLLKPAVNQTAYLKAGILGFAGSGKTLTSSKLAIGLAKKIGNKKPVAFFDTETGSDFLIDKFKKEGIELLVAKTRAFSDLMDFMKEAQAECSVAIIDSISHVWTELRQSFEKKLRRQNGLLFQDWGKVKGEWQQFTDSYLNAKVHTIICGRAGYEYDFEQDESGKKELIKTGTKMKAEGEFGYEPSFSIEMERINRSEFTGKKDVKGWVHKATILKDRTQRMNGDVVYFDPEDEKCIDPFDAFKPVIDFLNIGGEHVGIDTTRNSEAMFDGPDKSFVQRARMTEITLEEIKAEFVKAGLDGSGAEAKKGRIQLLEDIFKTSSWSAVEAMSLENLKLGLEKLRERFGARPQLEEKVVGLND